MNELKVAVVGVGRIGAVTAVGLAHLLHDVTGIDVRRERVEQLREGQLAEAEPGLRAALRSALRLRQLRFSVDAPEQAVEFAFLCVDTPPTVSGQPDLTQLLDAACATAPLIDRDGVLITRSTVPVGTGERIEAILLAQGRSDVTVVHLPEFLREGRAWEDFREPDRIVVGANDPAAADRVSALFDALERPIIRTDRRTAELAKYATNAFLATSVTFANEISGLCDALAVDAATVFEVLRADRRIGREAYLQPGLGFGGHCLPKDAAALAHMARIAGQPVGQLQATRLANEERTRDVAGWLRQALGRLDDRLICIAGLAFKAGTDDLREAPALALARLLQLEGARISGWDPLVPPGLLSLSGVTVRATLGEAVAGADALIIAHSWPGLDYADPFAIAAQMARAVVYDAPAALDINRWRSAGFVMNRTARGAVAAGRGERH